MDRAFVEQGGVHDRLCRHPAHGDDRYCHQLSPSLAGHAHLGHLAPDDRPPRPSRNTSWKCDRCFGGDEPEPEKRAEGAHSSVIVAVTVDHEGATHVLRPGAFAFLPAGSKWTLWNKGAVTAKFHWIH